MYTPNLSTVKVKIQQVSLTAMQEAGHDISDDGHAEMILDRESQYDQLLVGLTQRQRKVADLLAQGYERSEVGIMLGISHQAVHQIVSRIRERIIKNGGFHDRTRR